MNESKDFEEFLKCLNGRGVRALIVGAHAVAFHAKPRYTKDLDLLVEPSEDNARKILDALRDFGFGSLSLTPLDLTTAGKVIQLGYPPHRIDLVNAIDGVTFAEAWTGRVRGRFGEQEFDFIGKAELIRNKAACGRPQDKIDVEWLKNPDAE